MRYRAAPAGTVRTVTLDAMTALYDRRSGMTHLVAEPVPAILAALNGDAMGLPDLAARLGVEDEMEALHERLDELVATGLVEAL